MSTHDLQTTTIRGLSAGDSIRFTPLSGVRAGGFQVTAHVSNCTVTHDYITFFAPAAFLNSLREFERSRSGSAILEGSPDFRLTIGTHGSLGAAFLRFDIRDPAIFLGDSSSGSLSFSAGFVIPGELVTGLPQQFAEIVADAVSDEIA